MGYLHEPVHPFTIEERRESFVIHPNYGYTDDGNEHSDAMGTFGRDWRESPHPEFLTADLDALIAALQELAESLHSPARGARRGTVGT